MACGVEGRIGWRAELGFFGFDDSYLWKGFV